MVVFRDNGVEVRAQGLSERGTLSMKAEASESKGQTDENSPFPQCSTGMWGNCLMLGK